MMALGLVALMLYAPGFWWGTPRATAADRVQSWGVDDVTPLGPLAEIHNIIHPKPDRNLGYPLMHPFLVAGAYSPYLGFLWATGSFSRPSATYPFGLANPVTSLRVLAGIGHFLSVLMALVVVLSAFDAGRVLWGSQTGTLAALFAMTSFPMFFYARTGNVDMAVLCFTAVALAATARVMVGPLTAPLAIVLGAGVGFALGTKEPSVASFLSLPFFLFPLQWGRLGGSARLGSWSFWRTPALTALAAFVAFGLGSGLLVDHERFFAHIAFMRGRVAESRVGEVAFVTTYPFTWSGHVALVGRLASLLMDSMTLPGLLLAGAGIVATLRKEKTQALFLLPALTYIAVLFLSARIAQLRYMMPVAFTLSFFAARAVTLGWNASNGVIRWGSAALASVGLLLGLGRGVDLTYAMVADSHYTATRWLDHETHPGDRVEYFGPAQKNPGLAVSVVSAPATPYEGAMKRARVDSAAAEEILAGWAQRQPRFILIQPDYTNQGSYPYSATCPPAVYEALQTGRAGYRLAGLFQTERLLPWVGRPELDHPDVNPPIRIFERIPAATLRSDH